MIFMLCQGQIITAGMGEVIDISIPAIRDTMDICGVKDQKSCLMKVISLFRQTQRNRKAKKEE
jgi:hypothetical protein